VSTYAQNTTEIGFYGGKSPAPGMKGEDVSMIGMEAPDFTLSDPSGDKPTYPANLCPLFRCAEVACNCEDFGETVRDAVQTAARSAVRQGAPEHLYQVLSGQQGVHDSF